MGRINKEGLIICQFASWKEDKEGNVFFLQDSDLKGKKFTEYKKYNPQWQGDIMGHRAIEYFYPKLENLQDKECTDFSTPDNFPKELVEVIKTGKLTKFGCSLDLLNSVGQKKYNEIEQSAWAKYNEIEQSAWAKYNEIKQSAWAKYNEIKQPAWAKYNEIKQPAWAKYNEIKQPAFWKLFKMKKYKNPRWK